MLTQEDFEQLGALIETKLKKELRTIKKDLRKIKKDINFIIEHFDVRVYKVEKRTERIEDHLRLAKYDPEYHY